MLFYSNDKFPPSSNAFKRSNGQREKTIRLEIDLCMHKLLVEGHLTAPVSEQLSERNKANAPIHLASTLQDKETAMDHLKNQLKKLKTNAV